MKKAMKISVAKFKTGNQRNIIFIFKKKKPIGNNVDVFNHSSLWCQTDSSRIVFPLACAFWSTITPTNIFVLLYFHFYFIFHSWSTKSNNMVRKCSHLCIDN